MKNVHIIAAFALLLGQLPAHAVVTCETENTRAPATSPTASFILHTDGTATDTTTGLMWMRCSLGQTWNGDTCSGNANTYTWQEALQRAQDINFGISNADNDNAVGFAGYTDWRLPNKNELESIVELRCRNPAINAAIFPAIPSTSSFWSSSPYEDLNDTALAWRIDFWNGEVLLSKRNDYEELQSYSARLVRAGR